MSSQTTHDMMNSRSQSSNALYRAFSRWLRQSAEGWQKHKMSEALHRLDDRMLTDIGLSRSDIPHLVSDLHSQRLHPNAVGASSGYR